MVEVVAFVGVPVLSWLLVFAAFCVWSVSCAGQITNPDGYIPVVELVCFVEPPMAN